MAVRLWPSSCVVSTASSEGLPSLNHLGLVGGVGYGVLSPVHLVESILAGRVGANQLPGVFAPSIATMTALRLDWWGNLARSDIPPSTAVPVALTATPRFRTRSALVHPPFSIIFNYFYCHTSYNPSPCLGMNRTPLLALIKMVLNALKWAVQIGHGGHGGQSQVHSFDPCLSCFSPTTSPF